MNIHPESPAPKSKIKRKATLVGLDKIDYDKTYQITKLDSINPNGYSGVVLSRGVFQIVGTLDRGEVEVWLYASWFTGEWFKTSPVQKVRKLKNGYKVITHNSIYRLTEK